MAEKQSVAEMVEQLPEDAKFWVKNFSTRPVIDRLLKDVGPENFAKHWREHKEEQEYYDNF